MQNDSENNVLEISAVKQGRGGVKHSPGGGALGAIKRVVAILFFNSGAQS